MTESQRSRTKCKGPEQNRKGVDGLLTGVNGPEQKIKTKTKSKQKNSVLTKFVNGC